MTTYVVVACHFANANELCPTTIARLERVVSYIRIQRAFGDKDDRKIVVTGDVPYEPGGPTLGELMKEWLVEEGIPSDSVIIHRGGVGTFSEARIVCSYLGLKREKNVIVFSSDWFLFQGRPVYKRRARENGLQVSFVPVRNTGGLATVATYVALGLIIRGAILLGLERVVENRLTASQCTRRDGFKWDGCR